MKGLQLNGEKNRASYAMFPLYRDKNEKDTSLKRMSDKFKIFSD